MNENMRTALDIQKLQKWFLLEKRELSFRKTRNPYNIWVSEIMLQQTKVDTVLPYYNRFIKAFPSVTILAEASQEQVLKVLEGIGYYRRFKYMLETAKVVVKIYDGVFPSTYKEILNLPGIGKYTAGAIMSIAYNQPYAATDGNVIRVLSRVYDIEEDMRIEKNKAIIYEINQELINKSTPYIYTESIMELGALICLPKKPLCYICPIQYNCIAYNQKKTEVLPNITKLPAKKSFNYICLVIHKDNQIFLRKRTEKLLEGLYEYPQFLSESFTCTKNQLEMEGIKLLLLYRDKTYKHVFTHQKWNIDVYHVKLILGIKNDWTSVKESDLLLYPMAKAHRQITHYKKTSNDYS